MLRLVLGQPFERGIGHATFYAASRRNLDSFGTYDSSVWPGPSILLRRWDLGSFSADGIPLPSLLAPFEESDPI